MHPLWIFLIALAAALGSVFALQARWSGARRTGIPARTLVIRNALGWLAAVVAGASAYVVLRGVLQVASNRVSAMLSAIIGLGAFTLVTGRMSRRLDGPRADFVGAALSGALQLAVLVGFPVAAFFGIYWMFGN